MKDWLRFYFSFKGRATRYDFLVRYVLVVWAATIVTSLLDWSFFRHLAYGPVTMVLIPFVWVSVIALSCRRLHDHNLSGWHILTYLVVLGNAIALFLFIEENFKALRFPAFMVLMVLQAVAFFYLYIKRGTVGPNRFGPDQVEINKELKKQRREKRADL